ncbi:MAG: hypothetical protein OCD01_00125 [Fibrobacterales bacterium]
MTSKAFKNINTSQESWKGVRIYWTDTEQSFDKTHENPQLDFSDEYKKEIGDYLEVETDKDDDNKPTLVIENNSSLQYSGKNKHSGVFCNSVRQWVILEITPGGSYLPGRAETWPNAEVWSFLQPPSIGKAVDENGWVVDDFPRIGFFFGEINGADQKLVSRRHDTENKQITQDILVDTETDGVIKYKFYVDVRNDHSQKGQAERLKKIHEKYGEKYNPNDYTAGCYLKIWARNADYDFESNFKSNMLVEMDNDALMTNMNNLDPIRNDRNNPQTYQNHTWRRDRIISGNKNLMLIALIPKESIQLINKITPSSYKAAEPKEINWVSLLSISTAVSVFSGVLLFAQAKMAAKGKDRKQLQKGLKTIDFLIDNVGAAEILAAYAVAGFDNFTSIKKTIEEAENFEKLTEVLGHAYKAAIKAGILGPDFKYKEFVSKTKTESLALAKGMRQVGTKKKGYFWPLLKNIGNEFSDEMKMTSQDGDTYFKKVLNKLKSDTTKDNSTTFGVELSIFEGKSKKVFPQPCGLILFGFLNFQVKLSASAEIKFKVSYDQKDEDDGGTKHTFSIGISGEGKISLDVILQAVWTMAASEIASLKDANGDDTFGEDNGEQDLLAPLQDLLEALAVKAYVQASLTKSAGISFSLEWSTKDGEADFDWDPTASLQIDGKFCFQLSYLQLQYNFLTGKLYDVNKDRIVFGDESYLSLPFMDRIELPKKEIMFYESKFGKNIGFSEGAKDSIVIGEWTSFELQTLDVCDKPGLDDAKGLLKVIPSNGANLEYLDDLKLVVEECAEPNKGKWALVCHIKFTLDKLVDKDGETEEVQQTDDDKNIISLFELSANHDFFKGHDDNVFKVAPQIKEPGKKNEISLFNEHLSISKPEVKVNSHILHSNKFITYNIQINNYLDKQIWVKLREENIGWMDGNIKVKGNHWNLYKLADTTLIGQQIYGSLVIDKNDVTDWDEGSTECKVYPLFQLCGDQNLTKATSKAFTLLEGSDFVISVQK